MNVSLGEVLLGVGGLLAGTGALVVFVKLAELIDKWIERVEPKDDSG